MQRIIPFLLLNLETMRNRIAIFFLLLLASATTELGQFFKVPVLVQHFYTHQSQESITLLNFLAEHYVGDHEDGDKKDDMQLPFKSMMGTSSIVANFSIHKIELRKPIAQKPEIAVPLQISILPSQWEFGIFHPPRTV